jgi:peptidoglycan/xylan/chitin deacetylase (PgdA/CDA1 family)
MMTRKRCQLALLWTVALGAAASAALAQQPAPPFKWPDGKRAALSLSFDDARASQVEGGMALLDRYGVKATFYVQPPGVEDKLEGWKRAVANGHEIGNHSLYHPCSGNFAFSRKTPLEDYTLERMRQELLEANARIKDLLGVKPESFAYPCGETFVGRGLKTQSYVPVAASLFTSARGWRSETANDPNYVDLDQLMGIESDGKDFEQILPLLVNARMSGRWLVLAGHEMGRGGVQTTRLAMLEKLIQYALAPENGVWIAPVGTVARYVRAARKR